MFAPNVFNNELNLLKTVKEIKLNPFDKYLTKETDANL